MTVLKESGIDVVYKSYESVSGVLVKCLVRRVDHDHTFLVDDLFSPQQSGTRVENRAWRVSVERKKKKNQTWWFLAYRWLRTCLRCVFVE